MEVSHYWEDHSNIQRVKYESCNAGEEANRLKDERSLYPCCDGNLNFATAACSEDDSEYGPYKKNKVTRQDPMSHRIIEKRRRDRMNNCLADLSRLIPTEYLKKGRGRIEKTEIIEMAIKHMKYLQQEHTSSSEHYRLGYQECMSETMRFMVEVEGHFPREAICVRLLNHLQKHCEAISRTGSIRRAPSADIITLHGQGEANVVPSCQGLPKEVGEGPEMNNNAVAANNFENGGGGGSERNPSSSEPEVFEKYDNNGASYKYKNDIKLRFTQDLNAVQSKRQKVEHERRNSFTSVENQSSSHSSPPSSEMCTRISMESDNINRISPTESTISLINPLKLEPKRIEDVYQANGVGKTHHAIAPVDLKTNFNVPIFVLHSKGSFYVPLTVDYKTLLPFLQNYDLLEIVPNLKNIVLHPVTINVNFQPGYSVKNAKYANSTWN